MELVTYLSFDGDCEAAFKFYERVLGGRILMMVRYSEAPVCNAPSSANAQKVMHARLQVGRHLLMGGDTLQAGFSKPEGICVHIKVETPVEADRIYQDLCDGGTVIMPIDETFWAQRFGIVTDRFGTPWMINCERDGAQPALEQKPFIIARTFDVSRARLWACFTEGEHLRRWWGPKGAEIVAAAMNLQPGGTFHYRMRVDGAFSAWGKFVYREILPQERIVCVSSFSDEFAGLTRHPMAPNWPIQILVNFAFADAQAKTTLTVTASPLYPLPDESATFDAGHESLRMGWSGTLDNLKSYLVSSSDSSSSNRTN